MIRYILRSLTLVAATAGLVACAPPAGQETVDREALERVKAQREYAANFEVANPPAPPEGLTPAHQRTAGSFREICVALLDICGDAIDRCRVCDLEQPSCHRQCDFMTEVCEAAGRCVDAYVASLELAPE